jgi:hypothetical protein
MFEGLITIGLAVIGVIVWSVRQEGRINGHDDLFKSLEKIDELRITLANERHADVKERLMRIESKISDLQKSA